MLTRRATTILVGLCLGGCGAARVAPATGPPGGASRTETAHSTGAGVGRGRRGVRPRGAVGPRDAVRPLGTAGPLATARPFATAPTRAMAHPIAWALITAETENRLLVVSIPGGRVLRRIPLPADPEYVAPERGLAVATSKAAGAVTVLVGPRLRVARVIRGFATPQIVALSPDGQHAYVSDDARGTVTAIRLTGDRITSTVRVGAGAHHMSFSPDQRRLWVALGESARTVVVLDTTDVEHPRIVARFDPGFPAHDLAFSPDGRQVWISSAVGREVTVVSAATRRVLFRVPVGPPPQHIAFAGARAYVTSGYGSRIEEVSTATGRILRRAPAPYGSFELDAAAGFVVTASLLDGRFAIYTAGLRLLRTVGLAPATRDVALTRP